ncbi:2,3-diaminopropionate biosynthesis protein SbnA [Massilia sp. YIM B04103]|uniref:2,3-diaminopropionate biosynthesis protein SbnA n=1 Tax=Massilia sp. YIM B04103 TaxID=2963106 RepID=UPI00210996ED|nr:2,3-diaminopropionate biosynthesis protein SbnA [Massilia sp. YIM B04103]
MNCVSHIIGDSNFVRLSGLGLSNLNLKLESCNPAGSIKMKTAIGLIEHYAEQRAITPDTTLIESSSGNLGVALSLVCAERGYRFICVVDPNTNAHNIRLMEAYGAQVVEVTERDENGGFLGTRIRYVKDAVARNPDYLWLNQYSNPANAQAHASTTARSIHIAFPALDYLFVGAGTSGTLMGCVQYFRRHSPRTEIIAVDSKGSVTFGLAPGKRFIPGLGSSQRPPIFDPAGIGRCQMVDERAAIAICRWLARSNGILAGGSTGTVLAGVAALAQELPRDATIVAISPDAGERYLDTIYNDEWVREKFGANALAALPANGVDASLRTLVTTYKGKIECSNSM